MVRVITYGTFDLLRAVHLDFLEQVAALGDELFVGVSTDAFSRLKGERCVIGFEARIRLVSALRCVTAVLPEYGWEQKSMDVRRLGVDVLGIGGEWTGRLDFLRPWCRVVYLPRAEILSTALPRRAVRQRRPSPVVLPAPFEPRASA